LLSGPLSRKVDPLPKAVSEVAPKGRIGISLSRLQAESAGDNRTKRVIEHPQSGTGQPQIMEWIPATAASGYDISPNERIRFTISADVPGFVYVVDREIYSDRGLADGILIFPTVRIRNGANQIVPGQVIEIPAAKDDPPFLEIKKSNPTHTGEQLTVFFLRNVLSHFNIGAEAMKISQSTFDALQSNAFPAVLLGEGRDGASPSSASEVNSGRSLQQLLYAAPAGGTSSVAITLNLTFRRIQ